MRNEIKIGILTILAIGFSFWGFKYVQGRNLLSSSQAYHAIYDSASGVTRGTPVQIAGVGVGSVSNIELDQATLTAKLSFDINPNINIPEGTVATIKTVSMLGEMAIDLTYATPCNGSIVPCAPPGSALQGRSIGMIQGMLGGDGEGLGVKEQIDDAVSRLREEFFGAESDNPIALTTNRMVDMMENLTQATNNLNRLLASNTSPINQTMRNLADLSSSLAEKQGDLAAILENTNQFTSNLSDIELEETLSKANDMIGDLQATLREATESMTGLKGVVGAIQNGEGTLGQLIYDDQIYSSLERMSQSLDTLATDFAERPYRYIPFKSRNRVLRFDRRDERDRADEVQMIPDQQ